jgi:hypothetical protein
MFYLVHAIAYMQGKKTYTVAALTVLFGVLGWVLGFMPKEQAVEVILGGLGLGSLRNAIPPKES